VENKIHWVRDVVFAEDHQNAYLGAAAHGMALFRNLAISLTRLAGHQTHRATHRRRPNPNPATPGRIPTMTATTLPSPWVEGAEDCPLDVVGQAGQDLRVIVLTEAVQVGLDGPLVLRHDLAPSQFRARTDSNLQRAGEYSSAASAPSLRSGRDVWRSWNRPRWGWAGLE
jgi:hypothetical protein